MLGSNKSKELRKESLGEKEKEDNQTQYGHNINHYSNEHTLIPVFISL